MHGRRVVAAVLAVALISIDGCSFAVDISDVDRGCGPGTKRCPPGICVEVNDPAYGCTDTSCEPCEFTNAIPRCEGQKCAIDSCLFGFGCQNNNGCSTNLLFDRNNCGTCNVPCPEGQGCFNGLCMPD